MLNVGTADKSFFYCFQDFFPNLTLITSTDSVPKYDLIIFPGGEDIDTEIYGQRNMHSAPPNKDRDEWETKVFYTAKESLNVSMLGVCRGHQLINALLGGSLIQDIGMDLNINHSSMHQLNWRDSAGIWRKALPSVVNSLHHQCLGNVSNSLKIIADTNDGIVEMCINNTSRCPNNIVTVQFHPEFMGHKPFFTEVVQWAERWKERVSSANTAANKKRIYISSDWNEEK
jgi:gamma-glutamyl-gamma-aminobutyrate hydrolase PuuD